MMDKNIQGDLMRENKWGIAEAKMKLCELIAKAKEGGPQRITKYGRTTAVVLSPEDWDQSSNQTGTLAEFLLGSPLAKF
jgi:prevent-host-death family protein